VCRRLAAELGETVNVAIRRRRRGHEHPPGVRQLGDLGSQLDRKAHAAACDREWKSAVDLGRQRRGEGVLARELTGYTPHTITKVRALEAELARVREQGWASSSEELELGLNALAAPIRNSTGKVVAAVGVSGPSYRLTVESFPEVAGQLMDGACEISTRLGFFGSARR
jgi:DNA-binding IclR family transcriptional regulator